MEKTAQIKDIFVSIQGEGLYVGAKQLFIRFSGCNLQCAYCDTEHIENTVCYTPLSLEDTISKFNLNNIHSISLTGGEPLLHAEFLKEFLPLCKQKIYLETNGTLSEPFERIARYIDFAAIDIKLNSVSNQGSLFATHDKFIDVAVRNNIDTFVKVVFDNNVEQQEIISCTDICRKYNVPLILQPIMINNKLMLKGVELNDILDRFLSCYDKVRLIPQVHKFLQVE